MRRTLAMATIVLGSTGGLWMVGTASSREADAKVTICHGTASENNPYVEITVSPSSFKQGHFDGPYNKSHGMSNHPDFVLLAGNTCADGPDGTTTTQGSTTTETTQPPT